jgi:rhodanese-related sulfurtransferase
MSTSGAVRIAGLVIVAALFACPALAQQGNIYQAIIGDDDQKVGEVSTEQMRQILFDHSAIVLDTRPLAEFVNGHIPGANNLTGSSTEIVVAAEKLVGGEKGKALVLYCNGPFCQASRRLGAQLLDAGFTNVRRYQLGLPIWRALGGPTEIELDGIVRAYKSDQTAIFLDAASEEDFAKRTLPRAQSLTPEKAVTVQGSPMPLDDFNTRIIAFGRDAVQARALAEALSKRPWHNVAFFAGSFEALMAAVDAR